MTLCTCLGVMKLLTLYFDFSKALDNVNHGVLLHKLENLGITDKLGIWFFQAQSWDHYYS